MTSLTRIAITARKSIRYIIFFIIFISIGKILLDASIGIYKKIFPAPPPPPTVKFGKLTKIPFPSTSPNLKLSYTLQTPQGGLPTDIPNQAKVYFMPKSNASLLALDAAKQKARSLSFASEPVQLSDTLYKFTDTNFPSVMQMNIVSGTFSISYDLTADRSPIDTKPPVSEVAASELRAALSNANDLPDDLTGPVTNNFFKFTNQGMTPVVSLSEADVIKINLFRKNYDNLPSVTANPTEANVWAIISGSTNKEQQIIAAEYHYHAVDESQYSTYPIKTPAEAFSELQNGSAFIASAGSAKDGDTITVRRVYLAYFDSEQENDFYQPIYVFSSDLEDPTKNFIAYLPAIIVDYYGQ